MAVVRIVTDSTADLPADLVGDLGITVVPCQLMWGDDTYRDGLDIPPDEFYRRLAGSANAPRTSQPAVSSFVTVYRRLLEDEGAEAIVSVHVAGNLSGTLNSAWAAAQSLPEPWRVRAVDSGQVSMGLGWAVVGAARLARDGAGPEEVESGASALLSGVRTAAMIDTLDNLYKGGRISQFTALMGTALQIKPLVSLHGGVITVWSKVRTRSRAVQALAEKIRSWGALGDLAVLHTGAEDLAHTLAAQLQDLDVQRPARILPAGSALTSHLGLGAVGACALLAGGETTVEG